MRVVVVGGEGLPRQIAGALHELGEDVTFLDSEGAEHDGTTGPPTLAGDPAAPAVLERAGARGAEVLAAFTRSDTANLAVSYLAKFHFAVPRVVARVNDPANAWMFDQSWGVDAAICPSDMVVAVVRSPSPVAQP